VANSSAVLTLVANTFAADIRDVTNRLEVVIPVASKEPVLEAVATKLAAVTSVAVSLDALTFVMKALAADIRDVTNKLAVVTPLVSKLPILACVATKFVVVMSVENISAELMLVANKLAADTKLVTNREDVVTPLTSKEVALIFVAVTVCKLLAPLASKVPVEMLFSIKLTEVTFTAVTVPPTTRSPDK
jgi:hypothetical protein